MSLARRLRADGDTDVRIRQPVDDHSDSGLVEVAVLVEGRDGAAEHTERTLCHHDSGPPFWRDEYAGTDAVEVDAVATDRCAGHPDMFDADALSREPIGSAREVVAALELGRRHSLHVEGDKIGDKPFADEAPLGNTEGGSSLPRQLPDRLLHRQHALVAYPVAQQPRREARIAQH